MVEGEKGRVNDRVARTKGGERERRRERKESEGAGWKEIWKRERMERERGKQKGRVQVEKE